MGARRFDFSGKLFSPEAPFHEGRNESIFCSSAVGAFSGVELQTMRRGIGGDRKCPTDFSSLIPNQEKEMPFEIFHNRLNLEKRKSQRGCEPIQLYWPVIFMKHFPDSKIADQVVFRRHECEPCREEFREFHERSLEGGIGHSVYGSSTSH
jgi:hypothetical protein